MGSVFAADLTIELTIKFEFLYPSHLHSQSVFLSVSQLLYRNSNSYYRLLLLLSGDISFNSGPFYNLQPLDHNKWNIFKHRGLPFLHLNINSLLPKIDKLRHIARLTNAAVIRISESKLDDSVLTSEIQIDWYDLLRCDRNRHGGGVVCYVRNDLSYNVKSYFPKDIENTFFELLLPNTKPIVVGTISRPTNQTNFMEIFNESLSQVDTNNLESYINLLQNGHYVFQKNNLLSCRSVPNDVKNYFDFCTMFGLKQLLESPTRQTCSSSSIIDHILASFPERVTQRGKLNFGLSDHQIIYCTRKVTRIKRGGQKQIKFRCFKYYTIDGYGKVLVEINFSEYKNFDNVNDAYSNFIQKLMKVSDEVAPVKNKRIKRNSQEWFDSQISEKLIIRDKLFKKYKKTKLHEDKKIYKKARYSVQNLIAKKKKCFFENKLKECIGKPKDLWKAIKSLGLPNKSGGCIVGALAENQIVKHDTKLILKTLKSFYSNLARFLSKTFIV